MTRLPLGECRESALYACPRLSDFFLPDEEGVPPDSPAAAGAGELTVS